LYSPHNSGTTVRPEPKNGLGTAGFVLGLLGLLFSFIPIVGVIAWPMVILGIIFSSVGISKANKGRATNKGLATAGLVVAVVGLVMCIVWAAAVGKAVNDIEEEANRPATVVYEVTGDATNVMISYSTFGDGVSINQETAAILPWTKQVQVAGLGKGGTLTVTVGQDGGTVNCKVTVDGEDAKTGTASGPFATASCGGF
jgi:hypothetical protein